MPPRRVLMTRYSDVSSEEDDDDIFGETVTESDSKNIRKKTTIKETKIKFVTGDSYKTLDQDQIGEILEKLEQHPELWDKRHSQYKDKSNNLKTWHRIEKELGFLVVDRGYRLQKVWTTLVGAYKRQKESLKLPSGSGTSDLAINFEYFDKMKFVESSISSSAPSPTIDSTNNVTRRIVELDKNNMSRKRKRESHVEDDEKFKEYMSKEHKSIDNTIEMLLKSINEPKQTNESDEFSDIFQKIRNTMKGLDSASQFELKVSIARVCDNFNGNFMNLQQYNPNNNNFFMGNNANFSHNFNAPPSSTPTMPRFVQPNPQDPSHIVLNDISSEFVTDESYDNIIYYE